MKIERKKTVLMYVTNKSVVKATHSGSERRENNLQPRSDVFSGARCRIFHPRGAHLLSLIGLKLTVLGLLRVNRLERIERVWLGYISMGCSYWTRAEIYSL
jgi:hypothetical protein